MELVLVDTRSGRRRTVALGPEAILLGSGIECDVIVPSPDVPERACSVRASDDGIVLEAIGSGSFTLNEKPARAALLNPGDVVKLGPFQLVAAGQVSAAAKPAGPPIAPPSAASGPSSPPATRPSGRPPQAAAGVSRPRETREPRDSRDRREIREGRESDRSSEPRDNESAGRRRPPPKRAPLGIVAFVLVCVGVGAWLWKRGTFQELLDEAKQKVAHETSGGGTGTGPTDGTHPDHGGAAPEGTPTEAGAPNAGSTSEGTGAPAAAGGAKGADAKPATELARDDVAGTLARVDKLLAEDEFARCRWLLYQLAPKTDADRARIEKRKKDVFAAAKRGGDEYVKFVDHLIENGKLAAALARCSEQDIARFRGLETWYLLLEKADEIEVKLDESGVPDEVRPAPKRKHARPRPPDLATAPPPPIEATETELVERASEPALAGRARDTAPKHPTTTTPAEPEKPPAPAPPPSPEALAAQSAVAKALEELAAAKLAACETASRKVTDAAHAAKEMAIAPLLARSEQIADALEQSPERGSLGEVRRRVQELVQARSLALAFLFDEKRYPPAGAVPAAEAAKAQKEAERLVDAVRDVWGNESGSAPQPVVNLSDAYVKLVQEARLIESLLAELKQKPPDRGELLASRLVPIWAPKVSVRNYALTLEERQRIDTDRDVRTKNQQVKETKTSDELELLFLTNSYREMLGRPALAFDKKLYDDARTYSELMASQTKSQKDSDPQPEPTARVAGSRPAPGANYFRGHASPRQALQSWLKMPVAHRNLLDTEHRTMAAALAQNFWSQLFGLMQKPGK